MAAPASTVPAANPANNDVSFFTYIREVLVGTATVVQDAPLAVVTEAAHLMEEVPVVGLVCKIFLAFEKLVDTARSNRDDLAVLRELCKVVIAGVLDKRSDRSGLLTGFRALETHVKKAAEVARLCNGRARPFLLARKICKDIAGVKNDVLAFCAANNLVLATDLHAKVSDLEAVLTEKLTVAEGELRVTQQELMATRQQVALKTKDLQEMDKEKTKLEEHRVVADTASRVKVPPEAPRIRDWYVDREAVVSEACRRLMIGLSSEEPRMVGLAGPSGVGKSTVASMVVAREDVRASFCKGVLWLQVGQGAKARLPDLMLRLADMVYETVMLKRCRQVPKAGLDNEPVDGVAYIREVVDTSSQRFLVVADDVWDLKVLKELNRAEVWVLYTSRQDDLLPELPLRLNQVLKEEAEIVLRRAADLHDDTRLPEAAYDLMARCDFVVLNLALVGRWGVVRGRSDEGAWRAALERIAKAQKGGEGGKLLSWRAAVLHAGLEELACDNPQNKELYLSLAILPKGLSFSPEVAAVMLYGNGRCQEDLKAAGRALENLERWSILTLEGGDRYRIHDEHADFIEKLASSNQDIRDKILPRWREYISSVGALMSFLASEMVSMWDVVVRVAGEGVPVQPYKAVLQALDPSAAEFSHALEKVAEFHWRRDDWMEALESYSQLLEVQCASVGEDHPDVAITLHSLGCCACNAGRTDEAQEYYRRALAILEKTLGVDHPDAANTLHGLGIATGEAGKAEEEEGYYRRALAIQERALGVDHPDVACTLNNLAVAAGRAGKIEVAERHFRRRLAILYKALGVDHLDVAYTLHNLGIVAHKAGKIEVAEEYYRRALAIQEKLLGVDHAGVATTLYNLGVAADKGRRAEDAEGYYRRALAIREKALGVDHPDVATTLHGLGITARKAGRTEDAEGYYRRALAIRKKGLGVDHPDVANTLHGLGITACEARRTGEAEEYYRRALAIREKALGVDHPDVANTLHDLGITAGEARKTGEAEGYYRRALAIREKALGVDHLHVARTLCSLGSCVGKAGRTEEAEGYYARALVIRERSLGVDHPHVARTLHNLGVAASEAGRTEDAERYYRRALVIREKALSADHPDVAITLHGLGDCAQKLEQNDEAESLFRRALNIRAHQLGADDPSVVELRTLLADLGKSTSNVANPKLAKSTSSVVVIATVVVAVASVVWQRAVETRPAQVEPGSSALNVAIWTFVVVVVGVSVCSQLHSITSRLVVHETVFRRRSPTP